MGVLIMTAIIGMVRSWLLVPQPLVIIEDIRIEKFASAYGIFAVISGLVTIVFGAIVGEIRKIATQRLLYTSRYTICNFTHTRCISRISRAEFSCRIYQGLDQ